MPLRTVIPAAVTANSSSQPLLQDNYPYSAVPSGSYHNPFPARTSYGSLSAGPLSNSQETIGRSPTDIIDGNKGKEPAVGESEIYEVYEDGDEGSDVDGEPIINMTWKYMSRLYMLVPIITFLFFALLVLLVTFAWPPNKREREAGQTYPHPFLAKPFVIGIFASCTVQTMRIPVWVVVSSLNLPQGLLTFLSTSIHTILHELLRLSSLTLIVPSPTSGFHSSYYLGLGWGVAETTWGIVQGWDQLVLYEDVMKPDDEFVSDIETGVPGKNDVAPASESVLGREPEDGGQLEVVREVDGEVEAGESSSGFALNGDEEAEGEDYTDRLQQEDEADLERKVEILERMRGRRELEQLIGLPFPNIPFPLHLLWRLDTLLLNLGLTLLLSAYYFDPTPIYRHLYPIASFVVPTSSEPLVDPDINGGLSVPSHQPSKFLWLVWGLVVALHICVSLVWKIVGRLGVGAVTWGGLIVALGSVFAGLGAWGGLV